LAHLQRIWLGQTGVQSSIVLCLSSLGFSIVLLNQFNAGADSVIHQWINQPNISFVLQADGLSIAMILLTQC
jgi:NADH-quinone oxidoreductase subunit M